MLVGNCTDRPWYNDEPWLNSRPFCTRVGNGPLSTSFIQAAVDIINTFAVFENSESCVYQSVSSSSSYDPVTGTMSTAYDECVVNIAVTGIADTRDFPEHFKDEHMLVYVAGASLSFEPKEGDRILWGLKTLLLDNSIINKDMYGAAYALYMKEIHDTRS